MVTPYEGIVAQAKSVKYTEGCAGYKMLPLLSNSTKTSKGKDGLTMKCYDGPPSQQPRKLLEEVYLPSSDMQMFDLLVKSTLNRSIGLT